MTRPARKPATNGCIILHYRYRLLPTKAQHGRLRDALEHSRLIYNAALQERIDCYRKTGKGRTYIDQCAGLTELRAADGFDRYAVSMQRAPLKALDRAFKGFFRRSGFPRFKGRDWFKSIGWTDKWGWQVRDGRLFVKGIGAVRIHLHRPLPGQPISCRIKRDGRHWYVCLSVEVKTLAVSGKPAVGIDMGILTLAALSTGELIANARPYKRAMRKLRLRQRALARCKRGSKRRRKVRQAVAGVHGAVRRARDTHLHQISAGLVGRFGLIAIEAINVKGLSSSSLARDTNDASWGKFREMLRYKAERAGAQLIEVDPRYTSQTCPDCGAIEPKTLGQRVHRCPCGCVMDRDVAAAKVVLHRAVHGPEAHNVADYGERAPRMAAA